MKSEKESKKPSPYQINKTLQTLQERGELDKVVALAEKMARLKEMQRRVQSK